MKKLIIANWKAHPETARKAHSLARAAEKTASLRGNAEVVIAPPFPFLESVGSLLSRARLGAQDISWTGGDYTGMVAPQHLKSLGVRYVIVGHSERRIHAGETDAMIQKKIFAVLQYDMKAVFCVGEYVRRGGDMPAIVGDQIKTALAGLKPQALKQIIVAYEPVWAISTAAESAGPTTPDSAFRARLYIEKTLVSLFGARATRDARVIYGGSVTPDTVAGFLTDGAMDGVLVGGASLDEKAFGKIVRSAAEIVRC